MEDEEFLSYIKKHMLDHQIEDLLEFFGSYSKIKEFTEFIHTKVPIENKLAYIAISFNIYKCEKGAKHDI